MPIQENWAQTPVDRGQRQILKILLKRCVAQWLAPNSEISSIRNRINEFIELLLKNQTESLFQNHPPEARRHESFPRDDVKTGKKAVVAGPTPPLLRPSTNKKPSAGDEASNLKQNTVLLEPTSKDHPRTAESKSRDELPTTQNDPTERERTAVLERRSQQKARTKRAPMSKSQSDG